MKKLLFDFLYSFLLWNGEATILELDCRITEKWPRTRAYMVVYLHNYSTEPNQIWHIHTM